MVSPSNSEQRSVVFVSHASPEDNDFARWLTLQLAQHGYTVWCDVARLIGGEDFWRNIEAVIRTQTAKFVFTLSRASNTKQGPLDELALARTTASREKLDDFIIPLRIDDMSFGDMTIEMIRLNAISFTESWASGLAALLKKLETDGVPRNPDWSPATIAGWWREHYSPSEGVREEPEEYLSNWFAIDTLPETLFFHEITRSGTGPTLPETKLRLPVEPLNRYLISFAEVDLLAPELPQPHQITRSISVSLSDFLSSEREVANIDRRERRNIVSSLLRQSWETFIAGKDVGVYELANRISCVYLRKTNGGDIGVPFSKREGRTSYKYLTGYKTISGPDPENKQKRIWHFAISARPILYPIVGFVIYAHVIFSDDGRTPWKDKDRMHSARRQQCKQWWNPIWRDRILAFLIWLADGHDFLRLPAGEEDLRLSIQPIRFLSPVSYEKVTPATPEEVEAEADEGGEMEGEEEEGEEEDFPEFEGELDV